MDLRLIAAIFAIIAVIDRLFGCKLGLGQYFERGIKMIGASALAMVGMIVIAPVLAELIRPLLSPDSFIDPSCVPALLFANDMGGAALSTELCNDPDIGMFNGMVVAALMGCTVSFTIPVALGLTQKSQLRPLSLGILCGVVTIPVGCVIAGFIAGIPFTALMIDLLPIVLLAGFIVLALILWPDASVKGFRVLGFIIKLLITIGLVLGLLDYLLDYRPIECIGSYTEAFDIVIYSCTVMSGTLPLLAILSRLLKKPFEKLGKLLDINSASALGFVGSLATNMTTFETMNEMDEKGCMLNSAFAVSGAFILAAHLAFTMAFCEEYVLPVIIGKLAAGITAVLLCLLLYPRFRKMLEK